MKKLTLILLLFLNVIAAFSQKETLDCHNIIIDGSLSDTEAAKSPFIFNDFTEASKHFIDGTADEPMVVTIKPWVYWIDNPNDTTVMTGKNGRAPIGLYIKCEHLQLIGAGEKPQDVVLASRRGQTQGAIGNYTMLDFTGNNLVVKNLTMGNFCNVDLDYPLRPELSMKKRSNTITQAHVANCHGDNILAENVRFISRLNMTPLGGARRVLFKDCHMEMTDDALCSTGVYLHCDFDFYGQRPFWNSDTYGAIFIDCDFNIKHSSIQFFCKSHQANPVTVISSRYHRATANDSKASSMDFASWSPQPPTWLRAYQYNNTYNGKPLNVGYYESFGNYISKPFCTINLTEQAVRERFSIENILSDTATLATGIQVLPHSSKIQTRKDSLLLSAKLYRHCGQKAGYEKISWRLQPGYEKFAKLATISQPSNSDEQKQNIIVMPTNETDTVRTFYIEAFTASGLVGAAEVTVAPSVLQAPSFTKKPVITTRNNTATASYHLDLQGRRDQSLITWYRCVDTKGTKDIPVAITRMDNPLQNYTISEADNEYFLKAVVQPKHIRSEAGEPKVCYSKKIKIAAGKSTSATLSTNFDNLPTTNQPEIIPGFWTLDGYKPADTNRQPWEVDMSHDYWTYDKGFNGAVGYGLLQDQKGARLLYTPCRKEYGDMSVTWQVDPTKTGGQGFGSATDQYMDVYIKFDTKTLTGYALRIERTVKYGNAVDFTLIKYDNGVVTPLTESISSPCYRTGCQIALYAKRLSDNEMTISADVSTSTTLPETSLPKSVHLRSTVAPNAFGGFGLQHTGSCGESTTMIHGVKAEWK